MGSRGILAGIVSLLVSWLGEAGLGAQVNATPPSTPVKLVFIHHSTGEAWLNDYHGGLGTALMNNNYFVSDTNYGWGPDGIGNNTDLGNWWDWFSGPSRNTYMASLYAESGQNCSYARLATNPGGANQIVMFKSCFPNSHLGGSLSDPVPAIADNPLKGQSCYSSDHTVANAKGIYIELLNYFVAHPEKLFIVITAPPLMASATDATHAANARAFDNWLAKEWLAGYPLHNVFVFDFYNVLTSDGGSTRINDPNLSDADRTDGNHHRLRAGAIQHMQTVAHNYLAYWTGDSHPSAAGDQKATAQFVPLLNVAYHCWKGDGGCPRWPMTTPLRVPSGQLPTTISTTDHGTTATVTWDASLCASPNYHIVWGYGSHLASWQTDGCVCALGSAGSATWSPMPSPSGDPSRFLWFVVVGDDGSTTEGSWGFTSAGAERGPSSGAGASGRCGCTARVNTGYCGAQ